MSKLAAVLTGDLVASRDADPDRVRRAFETLNAATQDFARNRGAYDPRFTRYRGDGWQTHVPWAGYALEFTIFLAATLRARNTGIETRIAVGIGTIDTLGTSDLADAGGGAFIASGDALDRMKKRQRITIAGTNVGPWQRAVFDLVDFQMSGWSAAQAEVVALMLARGDTIQEDVARKLGITRQAVQARLASAGYAALQEPIFAFLDGKAFKEAPQ